MHSILVIKKREKKNYSREEAEQILVGVHKLVSTKTRVISGNPCPLELELLSATFPVPCGRFAGGSRPGTSLMGLQIEMWSRLDYERRAEEYGRSAYSLDLRNTPASPNRNRPIC